jgi:MoxR-like ATPase
MHLPEAQVDRFMLKVLVGYPSPTEEFVIVERMTGAWTEVQKVLTTDQLVELQKKTDQVYVDPSLIEYAVKMVVTPRAIQRMLAWAILNTTSCLVPARVHPSI